jgi:hypothetical protein
MNSDQSFYKLFLLWLEDEMAFKGIFVPLDRANVLNRKLLYSMSVWSGMAH